MLLTCKPTIPLMDVHHIVTFTHKSTDTPTRARALSLNGDQEWGTLVQAYLPSTTGSACATWLASGVARVPLWGPPLGRSSRAAVRRLCCCCCWCGAGLHRAAALVPQHKWLLTCTPHPDQAHGVLMYSEPKSALVAQ